MWEQTPPERQDRLIQAHLAAAQGPSQKLAMLCTLTTSVRRLTEFQSGGSE